MANSAPGSRPKVDSTLDILEDWHISSGQDKASAAHELAGTEGFTAVEALAHSRPASPAFSWGRLGDAERDGQARRSAATGAAGQSVELLARFELDQSSRDWDSTRRMLRQSTLPRRPFPAGRRPMHVTRPRAAGRGLTAHFLKPASSWRVFVSS